MPDTLELLERPTAARIDMIAGWRQWADAGSTSSSLPEYLIAQTSARRIGSIHPRAFTVPIPGTHDLVRPVIEFDEGFPESLSTPSNEFYYTGDERHGTVIFLGDEPHLDIDRYIAALLEAAQTLGVKRIVSLGGVYGELPYNKERTIRASTACPRSKRSSASWPSSSRTTTAARHRLGALPPRVPGKRGACRPVRVRAHLRFLPTGQGGPHHPPRKRLHGLARRHAPDQLHAQDPLRSVGPGSEKRQANRGGRCPRR